MTDNDKVHNLLNKVDYEVLKARSLTEWRPILTEECQVYVFGENYLAKRFDSINYKFCEKDEAKEILIDNLYALLRFKYFTKQNEEIDDLINSIVNSFTKNLKTSLKKVSLDKNSDANVIEMIPDYCIAFRNGVYNFKDDCWLFKYQKIDLRNLANTIYLYDTKYVIFWYMDYVFEPLPVKISETSLEEFIELMKELTKTNRNYCFELMYNISHDGINNFDISKFKHLCQILGFTCLQSFSQHFVMLIGAGQNGKNSLFDGCFTNKVVPKPASNDLESIENDRFITGALQNRSHNIYLESTTMSKTYGESKTIKSLTGSMYQTIENKGVGKYSGVINCKNIFAANDQDKLKFGDTTPGFRRRINMFEISYQWDKEKKFLLKGDYYDTTFSDSLNELKDDLANSNAYIYFAMYGIFLATNNFKKNFEFDYNDWKMKYADVDNELKDMIENITINKLTNYMRSSQGFSACKNGMYDSERIKLQNSQSVKLYGVKKYEDLIELFEDPNDYISYFSENDIYMNVRLLQTLSGYLNSSTTFTQNLKKIYDLKSMESMGPNVTCVKCTFKNGKLKILK